MDNKNGINIEDINKKYGKEAEDRILAENKETKEAENERIAREKEEAKREKERLGEIKKIEDEELLRRNGEELAPKFEAFIKECLTGQDERLEEICWLEAESYSESSYNPFENAPNISKPISVREAILIKLGLDSILRAKSVYLGGIAHDSAYYDVKISDTSKCKEREQAQAVLTGKRKEELRGLADQLTDTDLDEKGEIVFRCNDYTFSKDTTIDTILADLYGNIPYEHKWTIGEVDKLGFCPAYTKGSWTTKEHLTIIMTKRELIKAGLDPELLGWHSLERVQEETIVEPDMAVEEKAELGSKDIVLAEQKVGLTRTVMNSIKSFFDKMMSKGKNQIER